MSADALSFRARESEERLSFAQVQRALMRCMAAHPPAGLELTLHPEANALADVFGLMSYTRMTDIERGALKPGQLEAFERWRE